jgi:hypothetical protein
MTQSIQDLERVIRRKKMNRGQTTLLKYLYEANNEWVPRDELIEEIRWGNHESFVGVLSAFSNRINHTEGITGNPGYGAFIERMDIDGEERFRLQSEAREAIDRVEKLLNAFDRPMEELLDNQGVPIEFEPLSLPRTLNESDNRSEFRWIPDTREDRLLVGYWNSIGGIIVPEVHIGSSGPSDWPPGSGSRRIDGLRFRSEYRDEITTATAFTQSQLRDIVSDRHVEVIEVKSSLNRPVIGQAIAGRDMFHRDYEPRTIEPVIVCGSGDPALEWVCRRNGIRVEIVEPTGSE